MKNMQTGNAYKATRFSQCKHLVVLVVFGFVLLLTPVFAQQMPPKKMSLDEMVPQASSYLEKMETVEADGNTLLTEARSERNIQKLSCLNDTLTAIKGLLRLSDQNLRLLKKHVKAARADQAEHEYVKIWIAFTKVRELDGRIRACGGPSDSGSIDGRPFIDRIKDPDLPTEDPLAGFSDVYVDIQRPPSASPYF